MKNILVCVSGMSPAIITETYYWLAKCRHEAIVADELLVITTGGGKQKIIDELLQAPNNRFEIMAKQYGWPANALKVENIYVAKDSEGVDVDDVRSADEFNFFANEVLNVIREQTQDDNNIIHASLAGGRKTMSYYLGLAMNIFGRRNDTLSHVLLKTEYEQAINFYYPGQTEALKNREGDLLDLPTSGENIVEMSEFPLINLSAAINVKRLRNSSNSFESVLKIIKEEQDNYVHSASFKKIERNKNEISFGEETRVLPPAEFAVLLLLGYYAKQENPVVNLQKDINDPSRVSENLKTLYLQCLLLREFIKQQELDLYSNAIDFISDKSKELKGLILSNNILEYFEPLVSRLKKELRSVSNNYVIEQEGGKHQLHENTLSEELYDEVNNVFEENSFIFELSVDEILNKLETKST